MKFRTFEGVITLGRWPSSRRGQKGKTGVTCRQGTIADFCLQSFLLRFTASVVLKHDTVTPNLSCQLLAVSSTRDIGHALELSRYCGVSGRVYDK